MPKKTKTFAEFKMGDGAEFSLTISQALMDRFAKLSGDRNPLHVDQNYAKQTSFGGTVAHGMIAGMLFSRLVGMYLPGKFCLYLRQILNFRSPIPPGTAVTVSGKITHKTISLSLLSINTKVVGKNSGKLYVDGEAIVKVLK